MSDWRKPHYNAMLQFLEYLNERTHDFVLKGGTGLMLCYGLDRFSEDIDLDCEAVSIIPLAEKFIQATGWKLRVAKNTHTVERVLVDYGDCGKPLKIEVSYRQSVIDRSSVTSVRGITVYDINRLASLKVNAFNGRDKLRDMYDIAFICQNYLKSLRPDVISQMADVVGYKGLEQFDYLVKQQRDELIDNDKLADMVLRMFESLHLLGPAKNKDTDITKLNL